MATIQCKKCGHEAQYDHRAPEACPACGAVYSKVEATAARPAAVVTPKALDVRSASDPDYVARMRRESIYPTFRGFVSLGHFIVCILAVVVALSGVIGTFTSGSGAAALLAIPLAVLLFLISRFFREAWFMLADLSDAAVRIAAKADRQ